MTYDVTKHSTMTYLTTMTYDVTKHSTMAYLTTMTYAVTKHSTMTYLTTMTYDVTKTSTMAYLTTMTYDVTKHSTMTYLALLFYCARYICVIILGQHFQLLFYYRIGSVLNFVFCFYVCRKGFVKALYTAVLVSS